MNYYSTIIPLAKISKIATKEQKTILYFTTVSYTRITTNNLYNPLVSSKIKNFTFVYFRATSS